MREKGLGRVYAVLFILLWLIFWVAFDGPDSCQRPASSYGHTHGRGKDGPYRHSPATLLLWGSHWIGPGSKRSRASGSFWQPSCRPWTFRYFERCFPGCCACPYPEPSCPVTAHGPVGGFYGCSLDLFFVALLGRRSFKASVTYLLLGGVAVSFFVRPLCQDSLALHQRPSCSSTSSGP